ncbi:unnamed protein product [Leptosia nina]|uniref:Uncharacterized protein n=1 Tax=Leptosia nina TaxID=320188 RepID=A0AAV1K656_9NEOP
MYTVIGVTLVAAGEFAVSKFDMRTRRHMGGRWSTARRKPHGPDTWDVSLETCSPEQKPDSDIYTSHSLVWFLD